MSEIMESPDPTPALDILEHRVGTPHHQVLMADQSHSPICICAGRLGSERACLEAVEEESRLSLLVCLSRFGRGPPIVFPNPKAAVP